MMGEKDKSFVVARKHSTPLSSLNFPGYLMKVWLGASHLMELAQIGYT